MNMPAVLDTWTDLVDRHGAWSRVGEQAGREPARKHAVGLVGHLASVRRGDLAALDTDPWQDPGFAPRHAARVADLLAALPVPVALSAGEAGLLAVLPFVHDTLWARRAAAMRSVRPRDLTPTTGATGDRAAFERYCSAFSRLVRRATVGAGSVPAAAPIGWWLLHRWVARDPGAYQPATLADLVTPGLGGEPAGPYTPARLAELLRALRADAGFLARTDRPGALAPAAGPDPDDPAGTVRERLVGYLLATGYALAVESTALPDIVVEHVGIGDPVEPAELRSTVDSAQWRPRGTALVLDARCPHPAVEVALRTHTERVNALLAQCQAVAGSHGALAPLAYLPVAAATDELRPATAGGALAYQSAGVRFRLAEDRVQELLMGEQLYGDPALAVRELYQNALDACRYRQARDAYLRRTGGTAGEWTGAIRFSQGTDEHGRSYLDCADNGVGMGVRELSEVFSQAGVRAADLPEFLEEQDQWARLDPPVTLYPNSRFGIGVLSYFMLADEISVRTCRLGRDGQPGRSLAVSIAGPGSLFRIRDHGPGTAAGTTIRLYLRPDAAELSCVDVLREVLWVADFDTVARAGTEEQHWPAGELAGSALVPQADDDDDDDEDGPAKSGRPVARTRPVSAAAGGAVWWCAGDGAVLADGLVAGQSIPGAVVNLAGPHAPRLSVDRTKMLGYDHDEVERLLRQAIPAAVEPAGPICTPWLATLSRTWPRIADDIFGYALAHGRTGWRGRKSAPDVALAGCFPADNESLTAPGLAEWRLTAQVAGGRYRKLLTATEAWRAVVVARPTDSVLLSVDLDGQQPWLDSGDQVPLAHVARAARRLGYTPVELGQRLRALGYLVAPGLDRLAADPDDLLLTSRDLDGTRPFLDLDLPVPAMHLLRAAHRTGRAVRDVARRLEALGHLVGADLELTSALAFEPRDATLTSADLDGAHPWLDPAEVVHPGQVLRAAEHLGLAPAAVAARLRLLGYVVLGQADDLHPEPGDLVLMSRDLDARRPWLDPHATVPVPRLLHAAQVTRRPVPEVASRLAALGYRVTGDLDALAGIRLSADDLVITSTDLDGRPAWLDPEQLVNPGHLIRAAKQTARPVTEVVARLATLGYRVPPATFAADESDDLVIISRDLDSAHPWLDPAVPCGPLYVAAAAHAVRRVPSEVAARLAEIGFSTGVEDPAALARLDLIERDDLVAASQDLDARQPWLSPEEPVPALHLLRAAQRMRRSAAEVAARLATLGFTTAVDPATLGDPRVDQEDLVAASRDLDGASPWLSTSDEVPVPHLVRAAKRTRRTVAEVAQRLARLGYLVADPDRRLPRLRPGAWGD